MTAQNVSASGLDDLVFAHTRLSDVDGERGRLIIAGHDVEALAFRASFEGAFSLLVRGEGPSGEPASRARRELGEARARAFSLLPELGSALSSSDPMVALRASIAHLTSSADEADAPLLAGAAAVFAAASARARAGLSPVAPDPSRGHADDYLRMLRGEPAPSALSSALEAYLLTVVDHGMNASTFSARVVASTGSDMVSSIVAAIGALKGPLHGGAPGPVLDMLDAIGEPSRAEAWLEGEIASGRRIMGMGHRVYRVRDPRAAVLERAIVALESAGVSTGRLSLARAVERAAVGVLKARHPDRPLAANVEFYTAVLLDSIGLPREMFTPTFAVGRVAGWCAHVLEQRKVGRLVRPASRYVGPLPQA